MENAKIISGNKKVITYYAYVAKNTYIHMFVIIN